MTESNDVLQHTQNWVEQVIVKFNFCPFAKPVVDSARIRYYLADGRDLEEALHQLIEQCQYLDQHSEIETELVVYPNGFEDFYDFLDLVDLANQLLVEQNYEGVYQLANFHPDYCFDGELPSDPANYTNRSPYPILHLIREESLELALESYPNPEQIPERNIKLAREMGLAAMKQALDECKKSGE